MRMVRAKGKTRFEQFEYQFLTNQVTVRVQDFSKVLNLKFSTSNEPPVVLISSG